MGLGRWVSGLLFQWDCGCFFVLVRGVVVEGKCVRTDLEVWRENVQVNF
jgi:hypothetical protein